MNMEGVQRIEAPREVVWAALNSPEILKFCIPGCKSVEQISETDFKATVTLKIGAIKASFDGKVTLSIWTLRPAIRFRVRAWAALPVSQAARRR